MGIDTFVKSKAEAQALAEFLMKERHRHLQDVDKCDEDLELLKSKWGVTPRGKYVGVWIKP